MHAQRISDIGQYITSTEVGHAPVASADGDTDQWARVPQRTGNWNREAGELNTRTSWDLMNDGDGADRPAHAWDERCRMTDLIETKWAPRLCGAWI